jgi:hypothetical protein
VEIGSSPRPLEDWRLETLWVPSDSGGTEVRVLLLVTIVGTGIRA